MVINLKFSRKLQLFEAKEWIKEFKERIFEITQSQNQNEKQLNMNEEAHENYGASLRRKLTLRCSWGL